jgi:NAD(P)-dependent dehydrogenase (short-subunit alcohol dehydrogenase family)
MSRSVVVTGAADGIGRAIATRFAQLGHRVGLIDYAAERLERTTSELREAGGQVLALHADVRDSSQVDAAFTRAAEAHHGVDVAVNNAAVYPNTPVVEMAEDEWDRVLDTNLKGAFLLGRAAARQMVHQGRGGKLCFIASGAYRSARRGAAHYCASKAGLVLLAQTMALELAEHGITVNSVAPGEIATPMTGADDVDPRTLERPGIPLGRPGDANEVASLVVYLASPTAEYITGTSLVIDGGLLLMAAVR